MGMEVRGVKVIATFIPPIWGSILWSSRHVYIQYLSEAAWRYLLFPFYRSED